MERGSSGRRTWKRRGAWVKVAVMNRKEGDLQEELSDLTGNEQIIAAGQGELEDGQAVNPSLEK